MFYQTRLGFEIGADFSFKMYKNILYQPYEKHVSKNSSEVISGIITRANDITSQVLMPILIIFSSILMLIMILTTLILINPTIFISSFTGLGIICIYSANYKNKISKDSKTISLESIK